MTNTNSYKTNSKTSKQKSQTAVKNHLHVTRRATHEAPKYGYPYHCRGIKTHRRRCHRDHHPRRRSGYCWHHRWPVRVRVQQELNHLRPIETHPGAALIEVAMSRDRSEWCAALNRYQGRDGSGDRPNRATGIEVAMEVGTDRSEDGSGDRPKRVPLRRCAQPASRSRWKRDRSTGIEVAMDRPNRVPLRCCAQPASRLRWKRGSNRMMRCDDGRRSLLRRCQSQRFSNLNLSLFSFYSIFLLAASYKTICVSGSRSKESWDDDPVKEKELGR